jgi:hypothetical protein
LSRLVVSIGLARPTSPAVAGVPALEQSRGETPLDGGYSPAAHAERATVSHAKTALQSVSLAPQECRDVQQILRIGVYPQPITNRTLALNRRLIERCVIAGRHLRPTNHAH